MPEKMITRRYAIVALCGFTAMLFQTLLFREFIGTFRYTELPVGLFMLTWMFWTAVASATAGVLFRNRTIDHFHLLPLLYIPAFILQEIMILHANIIAGIQPYEIFPVTVMTATAFLINAPVSIITGVLFVLAVKWLKKSGLPAADAYIAESAGSFAGAVAATILLYAAVPPFTIYQAGTSLLAAAATLFHISGNKSSGYKARPAIPVLLAVCISALWIFRPDIYTWHCRAEYKWNSLTGTRDIPEGTFSTSQAEYIYGKVDGRTLIISGGSTVESYPDKTDAPTEAALNIAEAPDAEKVLIVGRGKRALAETLSECGEISDIIIASPDPEYYTASSHILPARNTKKCTIRFHHSDINTLFDHSEKFDLIIVDIPPPSSLAVNRFYTEEFTLSLKKILSEDGIISFSFPAGANFMGPEVQLVGASLYKIFDANFADLVLKPGEKSIFFITDTEETITDDPEVLMERLKNIKGATALFPPKNIESLFEGARIDFQFDAYDSLVENYPKLLHNTSLRPASYLYSLMLAARKAGMKGISFPAVSLFSVNIFTFIISIIAAVTLLRFLFILKFGRKEKKTPYTVIDIFILTAAAGTSGMILEILLIYRFQTLHGSIFLFFGLVSSLFMMGLTLGGIAVKPLLKLRNTHITAISIAVLNLLFIYILHRLGTEYSVTVFGILFFLAGTITGLFYPVSAAMLQKAGQTAATSGAVLNAADHTGAAAGGFVAAFILIPFAGITGSLAIAAVLPAAALLPNILIPGRSTGKIKPPSLKFSESARFATAGILVSITLFHLLLVPPSASGNSPRKEFLAKFAARHYATISRHTKNLNEKEIPYYTFNGENDLSGYIFFSRDFTPDIEGFSGPIDMIIAVDSAGNILDTAVEHHKETPSFFANAVDILHRVNGKPAFADNSLDNIDTVSGATISSTALKKIIDLSGSRFASLIGINEQTHAEIPTSAEIPGFSMTKAQIALYAFLASMLLFILAGRFSSGKITDIVRLIFTLSLFGFIFNFQYSADEARSLIELNFSTNPFSRSFIMVLLIPAAVFLTFNWYCGFLCPFGALQELAARSGIRLHEKFFPGHTAWKISAILKYLILLLIASGLTPLLIRADILQHAFAEISVFSSALILIAVFSVLFPRLWCRVLCPAGAFLSIIRAVSPFLILMPKIKPASCASAIAGSKESDCLCCRRCTLDNAGKFPYRNKIIGARMIFLFLIAVATVGWALIFCVRYSQNSTTAPLPQLQEKQKQPPRTENPETKESPFQPPTHTGQRLQGQEHRTKRETSEEISESRLKKKYNQNISISSIQNKKELPEPPEKERKKTTFNIPNSQPPKETHKIDKRKYEQMIRSDKLSGKKARYWTPE